MMAFSRYAASLAQAAGMSGDQSHFADVSRTWIKRAADILASDDHLAALYRQGKLDRELDEATIDLAQEQARQYVDATTAEAA
jgi:hypothetical protein